MAKVSVVDWSNAPCDEMELPNDVFGLPIREDLLHRAVEWQRARKRAGTHATRGISAIRGTTAKPYRQKGTGNARQGSRRSPQFRGGAVIFGPTPRSHAYDLPKKVRKLALKTALSAKYAQGKLVVLDRLEADSPKTREFSGKLKTFGVESALFIDADVVGENVRRAAANLPHVDVLPQIGANVYDVLRHDMLFLTKAAAEQLIGRLK